MTKKILLVGCGNIGSRHLQGLAKFQDPLMIEIVEPNGEVQKIAKSRLAEVEQKNKHTISWYQDIRQASNESDLVIIATQAKGRVNLINKLLKAKHLRFLVEKLVCQSSNEYDRLLAYMKQYNAKGWVNTTRRYYKSYQQIKDFFEDSKHFHISVIAGNMGLSTNAIHFFDLLSWFSGEYKINLNGDLLLNKIFPNQRGKDLLEFAGTITAATNNGSTLSINFLPLENLPLTVDISSEAKRIMVDELNEKVFFLKIPTNFDLDFKTEFQSNLTHKIVNDILSKDICLLPTLEDSSFAHKQIFQIFNNHIKKILNEDKELCPIT